jgi:hypothetical protein
MKIALLSESPADEAALRLIAEGVLGQPVEPIQPPLRARGWPSVAQVLPVVLRHLHFNTDCDGLIVTADADDTVVHTEMHERPAISPGCRLCELRAIVRQTLSTCRRAGPGAAEHGGGHGGAAVEAWYLCGRRDGNGGRVDRRTRERRAAVHPSRSQAARVRQIHPSLPSRCSARRRRYCGIAGISAAGVRLPGRFRRARRGLETLASCACG